MDGDTAVQDPDKGMTLAQVATALGLSRAVVKRMLLSGEIEGTQGAGATWRVSTHAVDEYRARQRASFLRFTHGRQ